MATSEGGSGPRPAVASRGDARYRVALIGTGRVGSQFRFGDLPDNHAAAVAACARCELVAGVNRGRERLEAFGRAYGVSRLYHDYRRMLSEVQPDLCIVATHPELHAEMVVECARAPSTRAILCEKPMALSLEECDRMLAACQERGVWLQVNHNRRWHPQWGLGLRLLREGAIGRLAHIHCYIDGGKPTPGWRGEHEGPLLHDFTHYLDLLDLYGGPVEWLCGMAEQRQRPWAVEDFAAAFLRFRSGATASLHSSELTEYTDLGFELRGTQGVMRFRGERLELLQARPAEYEAHSGFQWHALAPTPVAPTSPASTYVAALDELVAALDGRGRLRSDGEVGRRSIEMIAALYQSQLEGNRPVRFPVTLRESGVAALRRAGAFAPRPSDGPAGCL